MKWLLVCMSTCLVAQPSIIELGDNLVHECDVLRTDMHKAQELVGAYLEQASSAEQKAEMLNEINDIVFNFYNTAHTIVDLEFFTTTQVGIGKDDLKASILILLIHCGYRRESINKLLKEYITL